MRGQGANYLLDGSDFLGEAETEPKYEMTSFGPFPVVYQEGTHSIRGEVYDVPEELLRGIVQYEGDIYDMEDIETPLGICKAFLMYKGARKVGKPIPDGDWRYR